MIREGALFCCPRQNRRCKCNNAGRTSHITHRTARNEAHYRVAFALLCVRGAEGRILPWCALSHSLARVFSFASNRRRACNAGHSSHTAHRTHAQAQEGPHHTTTPRCALFVRLGARSWAMPRWCALLNHHWHIKHREHKPRNPVPPAKSESTALWRVSAGRLEKNRVFFGIAPARLVLF